MSKNAVNKSDEEIAASVLKGHDADFDILTDRYRKKLTHYVMRYAENTDEANDMVQETLIKAHKNIQKFDPTRKFSPWIYRIAHNEALTLISKRTKKKTISIEEELSLNDEKALIDAELSSLDKWFQQELKVQMHAAISELPDNYAQVIHLRYIEDLSYKEISDVIGKPVNTVGTLVRRAKKKLLEIVLKNENFTEKNATN